jgi:hypothetical protein
MKKLIIAFAAVVITAATTFAQGELNFSTRNTLAGVNAPVTLGTATGDGPGPTYSAALYTVNGTTLTLIPSSVTTFQAPGAGAAAALAKYVNPVVVQVPGVAGGATATLRMRAWLTSAGSFDAASNTQKGEGGNFQVTLSAAPNPPADLPSSITGFVIPVPEPSVIALGVLGAAALLIRRRK